MDNDRSVRTLNSDGSVEEHRINVDNNVMVCTISPDGTSESKPGCLPESHRCNTECLFAGGVLLFTQPRDAYMLPKVIARCPVGGAIALEAL